MKFIHKEGPPHAYSSWCKKVAGTLKSDYRELPRGLRVAMLECLLSEQGWICAYTMKRLDEGNSHIEHIKPESLCREHNLGSDLNYNNMVACFAREGMERRYRYGAQQKGNWWEDGGRNFVSPLHAACEKRFHFDLDGNINAGTEAAANTIAVLGLAHPTLIEERRRVIQEFVYGETGHTPLSREATARAIEGICVLDGHGRFYEFCVAIRDALQHHVRDLRRKTKKRKFATATPR